MAIITGPYNVSSVLTGTDDADSITGAGIVDTINGLGGNDTISGQGLVHGGDGDDLIRPTGAAGLYFGDAGNDRLLEAASDGAYVYLDGGAGDDVIGSAPDAPVFHGIPVATYLSATSGVTVDLNIIGQPQTIGGGEGTDTILGTLGVVGGAFNDVLIGSARADWIVGGAGDDNISAGAGNDILVGGSGNDTLDGGAGIDTVGFSLSLPGAAALNLAVPTSGVTVDLGNTGPQDIGGGMGTDVIRNIENIGGTIFADVLKGDGNANQISGGGGNDTIYGMGGDDFITVQQNPSGDTYIQAGEGNDYVGGGNQFDNINGNQGNDTLHGNAGNDWVVGGQDNDFVFGDQGDDIVYGNKGNDTIGGGDGNDIVRGGQDNDQVSGDAGNDTVSGDRGDDTLSGGGGADTFITFGDAGTDRVTDFNRAEGDRVWIEDGHTWAVGQVDADVVISVAGGATMTLVGVSLSSLSGDWISAA